MRQLEYDSALAPGDCPKVKAKLPPRTGEPKCNFAEVALAADGENLIVASINTLGCGSGQLRVGLGKINDSPFKVYLGPHPGVRTEEGTEIAFGVDLVGGCTGESGATRPAVASLGTAAGALLVWLAASAGEHDVRSDQIPVEALALEEVPDERGTWLNWSNAGATTVLGNSTSLSAPAVLALKSGSGEGQYLVAFPARNPVGRLGIQLLTVPAGRVNGFQPLRFLEVGAAHRVSLSVGNSARKEVGVGWFDGAQADAHLRFMIASTIGETEPAEENLSISPASPFAPQLLYQPTGFASTEPRGGWFLSWIEAASGGQEMFHVARVRDGDFESLGQLPRPVAGVPLLYPSQGGQSDDELVIGYARVDPSAGGSKPETIPRWCE